MMDTTLVSVKPSAPTYKLDPGEVCFHFLYGNVPGHEIDFIYLPEVPQPPLTRLHVNHLKQSVKFIEPRAATSYAFSIANLSRGDSQYEPGHGGIAFVFGLRMHGSKDHAGREDPPFCHAVALIDRHLDVDAIYSVSVQFYQKMFPVDESRAEGAGWYHTYVDHAQNRDALQPLLRGYVQDFSGALYSPPPSRLSLRWTIADKPKPWRRVSVVYPDKTDFQTLVHQMARFAAVLIESDLKWTAISNGREQDLNGGMTVRFIPRRDAENEAADDVLVMYMEQIPESPAEIAALLGMSPAQSAQLPELRVNIPLPAAAPFNDQNDVEVSFNEPTSPPVIVAPQMGGIVEVVRKDDSAEPVVLRRDVVRELKRQERKQSTAFLVGGALFVLGLVCFGLLWDLLAPRSVADLTADAGAPAVSTISANPGMTTNATPKPVPSVTAAPSATATASATAQPSATNAPTSTAKAVSAPGPVKAPGPATTKPATKKKKEEGWD